MRLSAAIRIGSMTTKQIRVKFTDGGNGRCALGAALDAIGVVPLDGCTFREVWHAWPWTRLISRDGTDLSLYFALLNDSRRATREQIADLIEQVEGHLEEQESGYLQTGITEAKPLGLIAKEAI